MKMYLHLIEGTPLSIAEPQTHLYLPHRLVVDFTIDGPTTTTTTTTTTPDSRDSHLNLWNYE